MRYSLKLSNGATVFFDEYSLSKKGIFYRNGTTQVYMLNNLFNIDSLERVRKSKTK